MPHELTIAMNVTDPKGYAAYRAAMTPILESMGGSFTYDLIVGQALKNPTPHPITRVFTMRFPDRATRDKFFADPNYLKARETHFTKSVDGYTVMAEVDQTEPRT
jgi:uncharacterized protein (DUF1330 family)